MVFLTSVESRIIFHVPPLKTQPNQASIGCSITPYIGKTLYLTIRSNEPNALGIGAGGNVVQNIKRDEPDPRLWDIANSKIVNIRLLETASFSSITGLESPDSPTNR